MESSVFEGEEDDPTKGTTEGTVGKNGGDNDADEHSPEEAGHESPPPPPPPPEEEGEDAAETVTQVTNTMKQTERINTHRWVEVTNEAIIIIIIIVTNKAQEGSSIELIDYSWKGKTDRPKEKEGKGRGTCVVDVADVLS